MIKNQKIHLIISEAYLEVILSFIILEIPNIIQIITLVTFLNFVFRNSIYIFVSCFIVFILLQGYLLEKAEIYMKEQIINPYSKLNNIEVYDPQTIKELTKIMIYIINVLSSILVFVIGFFIVYLY